MMSTRARERCRATTGLRAVVMMAAIPAAILAASGARAAAQAGAPRAAGGAGGAMATITGRITAQPDSLVVSLLTIGPGEQLFDRFGHAAIRVRNRATGLDSAWNWGMYDFESSGFVWRFLTGDTRYWMAGFPTDLLVDFYHRYDRAVWEQDLALTPAQADALLAFMRWNALPANKFYRYDYYLDNCSTRVRDAIDRALGGTLESLRAAPANVTWRGETLRLSQAFPVVGFGMTFALGPRADAPLSEWDAAFIPMRLRDALRGVRVPTPTGPQPLVRAERLLAPEGAFGDQPTVPSYVVPAAFVGLLLGILVLLVRRMAPAGVSRIAIGTIGATWHLVLGLAGTLVLCAGLFTRHTFMGANANVLLGTPLSLILVVAYARGWSADASERARRAAVVLSGLAAAAAGVALFARPLGAFAPADLAPLALVLPVHVALLVAVLAHVKAVPGAPQTAAARAASGPAR